jgi:hypothetical protein
MIISTSDIGFKNYIEFLDREYPKIKDKTEFDAIHHEVIFCNGRIQDFYGLVLIRFLMTINVLNEELPEEYKEWHKKEKERISKVNWEDPIQAEAESQRLSDMISGKNNYGEPDMSNVKFHYSLKSDFVINTIKTIEHCNKFWECYNLDLEYWSK